MTILLYTIAGGVIFLVGFIVGVVTSSQEFDPPGDWRRAGGL